MNVAQAVRRALMDTHNVAQNLTTSPMFTDVELLAWANTAKDKIEKKLRQSNQDHNLVFRNSTDSAFRWEGVTYAPSNMQLLTTSRSYTLPPDVLILRRIRAITDGEEHREFRHQDFTHPEFNSLERSPSTDTLAGEVLWDVVGERTLRLARAVDATMDIEIAYVPRSKKLQMYTTGTVTVTQNSTAVTGAGSSWVIEELANELDLIVSGDASVPKVASQTAGGTFVEPTQVYNPVSAILTDTTLTLLGNYLQAGASGRGYMLASRFPFPVEFTDLVSEYVAFRILKKARSQAQSSFKTTFDEGLVDLQSDTQERQQADAEYVEETLF